jgi:hypothetical protein
VTKGNIEMTNNWNEALEEIRALDAEYKRVGMTWSQASLDAFAKKRNSLRKEYKELILDGASQELIEKVETAQKARTLFLEEKRKESESWNSEKLVSEYAVTRVVLDMVTVGVDVMSGDLLSNRVDKLYKEVKDSQSKYKYRALVDLLPALRAKLTDKRDEAKILKIEDEAKETLSRMRETPEMTKTRDGLLNAFDEFSQGLREYKQVSVDSGAGSPDSPFSGGASGQLYNRIEVTRDEDSLPVITLNDKDKRFI